MAEARQSGGRDIKVSNQAVDEAFKALSNWGHWGKDDEIGTLNYVTPEDIVAASNLIRRGKIFALAIWRMTGAQQRPRPISPSSLFELRAQVPQPLPPKYVCFPGPY